MKTTKIIVVTVVGIVLIGVLLWAALFGGLSYVVGAVRAEEQAKSFSGTVMSITDGEPCAQKLELNSREGILSESVCGCGIDRDFLRYVQVDDIVNKVKDSLVVIVTRPSTEKVVRFVYPVCDH